ncbi:MAG: glycoside hydrolase family 57 protein, partial [Candidatus Micrarchaeota archaeon]
MPSVCLYFHVHQPIRLNKFRVFSKRGPSLAATYFNDELNKHYFQKAVRQCYLPANKVLLNAAREGGFKASFSVTGTFVEQAKRFAPEVLDSFKALAETGCIDFVAETFSHSLASLYQDPGEFREQVRMHSRMLRQEFGARPSVFRNTEVIYSNDVGREAAAMGFSAVLAEGFESVLGWRSPNYVYRAKGSSPKILFRNYRLSDDVGYRFGARWWKEWPLTADKYASWLAAAEGHTV